MTRVLVTGGMGFIGSHTVDHLVSDGFDVIVIDNLERQVHHRGKPPYLNSKARYIQGDVRSNRVLHRVLNEVDYVIHLAAAVGVGQSFWQVRKYIDTNIGGTATLYELLLKDGRARKRIKKIVIASSKSIYGEGAYLCKHHGSVYPATRPVSQLKKHLWDVTCPKCGNSMEARGIDEAKPPQNLSPYALSKYATETLSIDYALLTGIPTVAFRYFNVYGPRQSLSNPYTGVVSLFLSRLMHSRPPIVFEDGNQTRDFVFVRDVAKLNLEALKAKAEGIFNLGTNTPTSLLTIAGILAGLSHSNIEPEVPGQFRPGDNRHDFADNSKLMKAFPRTRFTPLKSGLEELLEWSHTQKTVDLSRRENMERKRYFGPAWT